MGDPDVVTTVDLPLTKLEPPHNVPEPIVPEPQNVGIYTHTSHMYTLMHTYAYLHTEHRLVVHRFCWC